MNGWILKQIKVENVHVLQLLQNFTWVNLSVADQTKIAHAKTRSKQHGKVSHCADTNHCHQPYSALEHGGKAMVHRQPVDLMATEIGDHRHDKHRQ